MFFFILVVITPETLEFFWQIGHKYILRASLDIFGDHNVADTLEERKLGKGSDSRWTAKLHSM